eukprot:403375688
MSHTAKKWMEQLPKHKMVLDPKSYRMAHPVYSMRDIETVPVTHRKPDGFRDWFARTFVRFARGSFDLVSAYNEEKMSAQKWMTRAIFLETVAGVPGMVGGMTRHLKSLRSLKPDHGWIHNLLEEAENERMHLFIFLELKKPTPLFKAAIILTQGVFYNLYFISYMLFPKYCHRFVGYLEEEAVHTYTVMLKQLDNGSIPEWSELPAPQNAREYYNLSENAKIRDVILSIRADESIHREVNHRFADLKPNQEMDYEEVQVVDREQTKMQENANK